jgi:hypothetical protein
LRSSFRMVWCGPKISISQVLFSIILTPHWTAGPCSLDFCSFLTHWGRGFQIV